MLPEDISRPPANVEVAAVRDERTPPDMTRPADDDRPADSTPPAKVEEAVPKEKIWSTSMSPAVSMLPANVEVAVEEVAWKYGEEICLHASRPPANVEVPVPETAIFRVVVGARADSLKMFVVRDHASPYPVGHELRQSAVRQIVVAEIAVVDAYGNMEAVVEVATK